MSRPLAGLKAPQSLTSNRMIESDGKNEAQLLEYSGLESYLEALIVYRATTSDLPWFKDTALDSLVIWLLWYTGDRGRDISFYPHMSLMTKIICRQGPERIPQLSKICSWNLALSDPGRVSRKLPARLCRRGLTKFRLAPLRLRSRCLLLVARMRWPFP